jgi:uncharacterized protein YpuA (DUF1002 family)
MNEEDARQIIRKTMETMKITLNEQALEHLQDLLDAGFDSFQEYRDFKKAKMSKSNEEEDQAIP